MDPMARWRCPQSILVNKCQKRLVIEERLPGDAAVRRLEDAARCGADIDDVGVALVDGEVVNAPSHHRRPDLPKLQRFESVVDVRRDRGRRNEERECNLFHRISNTTESERREARDALRF